MAEFAYNNSENAGMSYKSFELNCGYYLSVFFKNKCNVYSKYFSTKKLTIKLRELMNVGC